MKQTDKQIEIKTPTELLQFFDKYHSTMSGKDIEQLMMNVLGGRWIVSFGEADYKLSDIKLEFGVTLMDNFSKNKHLAIMRPSVFLNKKLLDALERPTTPEQIQFIKWMWDCKTCNWFKNSDFEGIEYPAHVKKYLGMK